MAKNSPNESNETNLHLRITDTVPFNFAEKEKNRHDRNKYQTKQSLKKRVTIITTDKTLHRENSAFSRPFSNENEDERPKPN